MRARGKGERRREKEGLTDTNFFYRTFTTKWICFQYRRECNFFCFSISKRQKKRESYFSTRRYDLRLQCHFAEWCGTAHLCILHQTKMIKEGEERGRIKKKRQEGERRCKARIIFELKTGAII